MEDVKVLRSTLWDILAHWRHRFGISGYPEKIKPNRKNFGLGLGLGIFRNFFVDFHIPISIPGVLGFFGFCTVGFHCVFKINEKESRSLSPGFLGVVDLTQN